MVFKFADNTDKNSLASRLRARRFSVFKDLLSDIDKDEISLIDIGGTVDFWKQHASLLNDLGKALSILIVNIPPVEEMETVTIGNVTISLTEGDATNLEDIEGGSFDFVFSNSVIEHVGNLYQQMAMADEVNRVGMGYFVQTPNFWFPLEPHFLVPFWQFLPLPLRGWMLSKKGFGWVGKSPDYISAKADCEQVRLLSRREMKSLFSDARIRYERVFGLPKSIIVMKKYHKTDKRNLRSMKVKRYLPVRE